jgi:hypothetical protein
MRGWRLPGGLQPQQPTTLKMALALGPGPQGGTEVRLLKEG